MKKSIFFIFITSLFFSFSTAQHGYNSASVGMGKVSASKFRVPKSNEIHITEYLNYHTHKLPAPNPGEMVHMDLQVSKVDMYVKADRPDRHRVLQIGFSTPELPPAHALAAPSNLCLLVDRSGSMQGDRIETAKLALQSFVEGLSSQDIVSLVVFDHEAEVWVRAKEAGNKSELIGAINRLEARGSTNMSAGVDKACQELMRNFSANQTNRVIILTDAMINTGELSPQAILAKHCDPHDIKMQEQVDFSLIGVGVNFNNDFARTFTQNPHNSIHFIHDRADIEKVFVKDAASLKAVAARQVQLQLFVPDVESHFRYNSIFGLDISNARHSWELKDMNYGLTQVALISFQLGDMCMEADAPLEIIAVLSYFDPASGEKVRQTQKIKVRPYNAPPNFEVEKNWAIANLAQALKSMSQSVEMYPQQEKEQANEIISKAIREIESQPRFLRDEDVDFMYKMVKTYQKDLALAFGKG